MDQTTQNYEGCYYCDYLLWNKSFYLNVYDPKTKAVSSESAYWRTKRRRTNNSKEGRQCSIAVS